MFMFSFYFFHFYFFHFISILRWCFGWRSTRIYNLFIFVSLFISKQDYLRYAELFFFLQNVTIQKSFVKWKKKNVFCSRRLQNAKCINCFLIKSNKLMRYIAIHYVPFRTNHTSNSRQQKMYLIEKCLRMQFSRIFIKWDDSLIFGVYFSYRRSSDVFFCRYFLQSSSLPFSYKIILHRINGFINVCFRTYAAITHNYTLLEQKSVE